MTTVKMARAPFPYFGGKQALVPTLLELLPTHNCYVEVFGGAGSLLFSKRPSKLEVFNDIDSGVVTTMRVLRDPAKAAELQRLLDLTPFSREEWGDCKETWALAESDVEMARRWFVVATQSFAGRLGRGIKREGAGWRYAKSPSHNPAKSYRGNIAALPWFTGRLQLVQIENCDWRRMLANYDAPETLFYCDPPYLQSTRRGGGYTHELSDQDHADLLQAVQTLAGMVIISGYDSPLYREHLDERGWERVEIATNVSAALGNRADRTEVIWLSPNATRRRPLLWTSAITPTGNDEVSA